MQRDGGGEPAARRGPPGEGRRQQRLTMETQTVGHLEQWAVACASVGAANKLPTGASAPTAATAWYPNRQLLEWRAAARPAPVEPSLGQAAGNPGGNEEDCQQVRDLLRRAFSGDEKAPPFSDTPPGCALPGNPTCDHLEQELRRHLALEEYFLDDGKHWTPSGSGVGGHLGRPDDRLLLLLAPRFPYRLPGTVVPGACGDGDFCPPARAFRFLQPELRRAWARGRWGRRHPGVRRHSTCAGGMTGWAASCRPGDRAA